MGKRCSPDSGSGPKQPNQTLPQNTLSITPPRTSLLSLRRTFPQGLTTRTSDFCLLRDSSQLRRGLFRRATPSWRLRPSASFIQEACQMRNQGPSTVEGVRITSVWRGLEAPGSHFFQDRTEPQRTSSFRSHAGPQSNSTELRGSGSRPVRVPGQ